MSKQFLAAETFLLRDIDCDVFSTATKLFTSRASRDRFDLLNHYSPFNFEPGAEAFPEHTSLSMASILDKQAESLLAKHESISVMWSGGVDSTAIMVALLKALPAQERERLTIYCTESSVEEAPEFYKLMVSLGLHIVVDNNLFSRVGTDACEVIVDGSGADAILRLNALEDSQYLYDDDLLSGIRGRWEIKFRNKRLAQHKAVEVADVFVEYGRKLGVEVTKFCELAWLFTFGCRMHNGYAYNQLCMSPYPNANKVVSFFQGKAFTDWAFSNYEFVCNANRKGTDIGYKQQLRDYIYAFDKCDRYYAEKGKQNSLLGVADCSLDGVGVLTSQGVKFYKLPVDKCLSCFSERISNTYRK